jgi:pimeloyl-ACP methyl ester carboxylesterase
MYLMLTCFCFLTLQVMALGHPVIVVQCPGVSMRLGPVLPADVVVEQVVGVLDKLGVDQACVIGHSYGKHLWLQHRGILLAPPTMGCMLAFHAEPAGCDATGCWL